MSRTAMVVLLGLGSFGALSIAGCAATKPSIELVNARATYDTAASSDAKDQVPDKLLSAEQALERAERAFKSSENSSRARALAYVAERHALIAMALASTAIATQKVGVAEKLYATLLEDSNRDANKTIGRTQNELARTRTDLEMQEAALAAKQKALKEREAELASKTSELNSKTSELNKTNSDLASSRGIRSLQRRRVG